MNDEEVGWKENTKAYMALVFPGVYALANFMALRTLHAGELWWSAAYGIGVVVFLAITAIWGAKTLSRERFGEGIFEATVTALIWPVFCGIVVIMLPVIIAVGFVHIVESIFRTKKQEA